jgi:hypothetical protein
VGTIASIPAGWALCNGQTVNGFQTPNMLDRFVIQAGGTQRLGRRRTATMDVNIRPKRWF